MQAKQLQLPLRAPKVTPKVKQTRRKLTRIKNLSDKDQEELCNLGQSYLKGLNWTQVMGDYDLNEDHPPISYEAIITPTIAKQLMATMGANRSLIAGNCNFIQNALENNSWMRNGESLKISWDWKVIDGQHRLISIIATGIPMRTRLEGNLDPDCFKTLDSGARRTDQQRFDVIGESYGNQLSAAINCGVWYQLNKGNPRHVQLPFEDKLEILNMHPELRQSAALVCKLNSVKAAKGATTFMHYMLSQRNPELIKKFNKQLFEGDYTEAPLELHPVRQLMKRYRKMMNDSVKGGNNVGPDQAALMAVAFLKLEEGVTELGSLVLPKKFPQVGNFKLPEGLIVY